ncbi:glycosyltransferase family 4 protein [Pedobacter cryoconitis]|uniref:glycosyltransferase family 4 protein n=1 Tax=Pedobacter cryoconitis TaxID=188932 RepID=UPI00161C2294|nr:glycosyltransferase family 4 protein [Pedobacter cryoconitis]MBB5645023.1 glycosyltransferase involved in cell wall biosynthesis [Pedobacter cryoconitis]
MKVLLLYDYPPSPSGLATQGDLLYRGLTEMGIDVHAVHFESHLEKEWYYRWFKPDIVTGVGYWGYTPEQVIHPQKYGLTAVPWLVADGYIANHQQVLNRLPLLLVTSNWVKEMYIRDGIIGDRIAVLPVGCDTARFAAAHLEEAKIKAVRDSFGLSPDQLMILTVGGDAASKGAREVMQALSMIQNEVPDWKYVCKVWPQPRTTIQNSADLDLADGLGIHKRFSFATSITSRNFMPYLISACDIYAAPSRLEGFGMSQVEAGACGKPVIGMKAMGMLDTMVHQQTALLAEIGVRIIADEVSVPDLTDPEKTCKVRLDPPRTVDYRADPISIAGHLKELMTNPALRESLGKAAQKHVEAHFDYRVVAKRYLEIIKDRLGVQ